MSHFLGLETHTVVHSQLLLTSVSCEKGATARQRRDRVTPRSGAEQL